MALFKEGAHASQEGLLWITSYNNIKIWSVKNYELMIWRDVKSLTVIAFKYSKWSPKTLLSGLSRSPRLESVSRSDACSIPSIPIQSKKQREEQVGLCCDKRKKKGERDCSITWSQTPEATNTPGPYFKINFTSYLQSYKKAFYKIQTRKLLNSDQT